MWEEAICRDFFDGDDRTFFAEFLLDGLLRGDTQARTAAYTAGINGGWLSKNDVRRKENMNPIGPEGDIYLSPMNMVPAGKEEEHQKDGNSGQEEAGVNDSSDTEENQRSNAHADEANAQKEKVAAAMRGAFKETWARIVRKEIKQVQAAARRKTSDEEFCSWVDEFAEEHRDFARDCLKDLYQGYAELVGKDSTNLDAMMRSYELEITSAAGDWVCKPSDGYRRSEGEIADYWTRRMLSYDPGEYETAA
jgi:hypothetical protein